MVAVAVRQPADVVLRLTPSTFPLETEGAAPLDLLAGLRTPGLTPREWRGWCQWKQPREQVRLLAAQLPPAAAAAARPRTRQKAQKAGPTPTAATLWLAGWVLVLTTLPAASWPLAEVLRRYRARWQVELVFKRMKPLRRLNHIRSTHRTRVEATVRALLVAWALQEGAMAASRPRLPRGAPEAPTPARRWLLTGLSLDTLRQQVQGTWSQARLRACLPRLQRFLVLSPRRREHQETAVRAWLEGRAITPPSRQEEAA